MLDINNIVEVNVALLLFSSCVTTFILIATFIDRTRNTSFMKSFSWLLATNVIVQLAEAGIWILEGKTEYRAAILFFTILSYGSGPMLVAPFTNCILELFRLHKQISMKLTRIMNIACVVCFLFLLSSARTEMIFFVNPQGYVMDGPWASLIYEFDIITFCIEVAVIVRYGKLLPFEKSFLLIAHGSLEFLTLFLEDIWYPVPVYLMMTLSLLLIFIIFHNELTEQLAKKDKELNEKRIAIMVSQIQPHFMYNSLNSIYYLCDKDVSRAKQAISDFSEYLRHILGSIDRTTPIHFEEELQNVKNYLNLEQMRFGEDLNIVYRIECTEFLVPALSIQPLVENAVKHGICQKEDGGTVILSTKETEDCFEVVINDNGAGFDPEQKLDDGKMHVGIQNVRYRLLAMCNATLAIKSKPNEGTTAIVRIPKEGENK